MFFSTNIQSTDVAETLRCVDPLKTCAEELRSKCQFYDFGLKDSFHSADDLSISYNNYTKSRPAAWNSFFKSLFPNYAKSESIMRNEYYAE